MALTKQSVVVLAVSLCRKRKHGDDDSYVFGLPNMFLRTTPLNAGHNFGFWWGNFNCILSRSNLNRLNLSKFDGTLTGKPSPSSSLARAPKYQLRKTGANKPRRIKKKLQKVQGISSLFLRSLLDALSSVILDWFGTTGFWLDLLDFCWIWLELEEDVVWSSSDEPSSQTRVFLTVPFSLLTFFLDDEWASGVFTPIIDSWGDVWSWPMPPAVMGELVRKSEIAAVEVALFSVLLELLLLESNLLSVTSLPTVSEVDFGKVWVIVSSGLTVALSDFLGAGPGFGVSAPNTLNGGRTNLSRFALVDSGELTLNSSIPSM